MYSKELWDEKLNCLQQHIEQVTRPEGGATDSQDEALYELQGQVNDLYVAWQNDSANK